MTIAAWLSSLKGERKSENTLRLYGLAARQLGAALNGAGDPTEVTRAQLESFIGALHDTRAPSTVSVTYRALQQFYGWMERTEQIERSPMALMRAPSVPEKLVPYLSLEQIKALLATCKRNGFTDRRDKAMLSFFIDTGCRRGEVAALKLDDLDLEQRVAFVLGKAERPRIVPIGHQTVGDLFLYLRARAKEKRAHQPELWLGELNRGPLQANGIEQMLKRRGAMVGIPGLHAHQFRHSVAHHWKTANGNESDLMRLMGWRSPAMVRRYGASGADTQTKAAHDRFGLRDKL
jgi:site-specific recombinase XerD